MQWILTALQEISGELIAQSMKYCPLNLAANGNEDSQIHCIRAYQPCENAANKLQSYQEMFFEQGFNPFFPNNNDVEDGNDDVNELNFVLKLTDFTYFLISFENYFYLS